MSSNPTTLRSSGIRTPLSAAASSRPSAMWSLAQNTAVIVRSASTRCPSSYPDRADQSVLTNGSTIGADRETSARGQPGGRSGQVDDGPVAEVEQVLGGPAGARLVVHGHRRQPGVGAAADHDQ